MKLSRLLNLLPLLIFFVTPSLNHADEESQKSHQWVLNEEYSGSHQISFQKLRYEIPVIMRQTMIDIAVRLGLHFEEGWQYPLTIQFVDGSPNGVENVLAYVELGRSSRGIEQVLNINLEAYDAEQFNFRKVYAHELVHAMMNDAIGAQAALKLPVWFHEGLAVYGSDQGEQMVADYHQRFTDMSNEAMINGLGGPHTALDYAEDYLAFKYIYAKHGSNALHNFVREVIARDGDIEGALRYTCFENWADFQKNAKEFSLQELKNLGTPKWNYQGKPY